MKHKLNTESIPKEQLAKLSKHICEKIGLEFPENKYKDLTRGISEACGEFGFNNANECTEWLIQSELSKQTWDTLAGYLTIGETYFFRDAGLFNFLKKTVLHDLIYSRWHSEKFLRIWSAACCTGEEPYSIAMLIHQLLPNRTGWNISIIGTDINDKFLSKAKKGVYTQWSFRSTSADMMQKYFKQTETNQFAINPEVKRMVSFFYLNLAEVRYPSYSNNTNELDLICCRNVLMYFSESVRKQVVSSLASCLSSNGWLIVSPGEADYAKKAGLTAVRSSDITVFRKIPPRPKQSTQKTASAQTQLFKQIQVKKSTENNTTKEQSKAKSATSVKPQSELTYEHAMDAFTKGAYDKSMKILFDLIQKDPNNAPCMILLARCYGNLKQYDTARTWCEKALNIDSLNPGYYYLIASIHQEQGNNNQAIKSLNQVLYLEPSFIMAYVSLGMIRRKMGRLKDFAKCVDNALHYLKKMDSGDLVPHSDDMTAGRLMSMLTSMIKE